MRKVAYFVEPLHERAWHMVREVVHGLYEHHAFDIAAAMSFYFFLSLMPLFIFMGFILGNAAVAEGLDRFAAPLMKVIPITAASLVRHELAELATGTAIAPLSVVGFLYLISSGTHNLMDVLEITAKAPHRAWWQQRVIAIAWNAGSFLLVAIVGWVLVALAASVPRGASAAAAYVPLSNALVHRVFEVSIGPGVRLALLGGFLLMSTSSLALFYRIAVRHPPGLVRRVWPGALVAIGLWNLVSWMFGAYVSTLGRYAVYYGSLAAVAVLLMWLYLTSMCMLVGAEVNAQLEGIRPSRIPPRPRPAPGG